MKTIKIDISQKLLDLPERTPIYYEAEYDPATFLRTVGEIPSIETVKQHAYEIRRVFTAAAGFKKEERVYAIKLDDRGIFEDLMQISNDVFAEKINKAKEDGFWEGEVRGHNKGVKSERARIKALPFWRRTFNKF